MGLTMVPLKLIKGTVIGRQMVTPGMVRVTLGGPDIEALKSTGVGDEYVRLFFPDLATGELVLPEVDAQGFWKYPAGKKPAHCECYTIRYFRDGEIDLDFVVHKDGRASEWAQAAEPGDEIVLREPYGIYEAPADADWQLFVCDATGLPALGRLLEGLAEHVEARVIVEVPDKSHEQQFESQAKVKIVWLHGAGNGIAASQLEDAVKSMTFPADRSVYVWVASEAKTVRPIRKYLRHELKWPATRYSITGYWTDKLAEWERNWGALDPAVKKQIDDLWRSGRDAQDVRDDVEAVMEKFGL